MVAVREKTADGRQYPDADESNLIAKPDDIPRKRDVLARHCQCLRRAWSEITVTLQLSAWIGTTHDEATAAADAYLRSSRRSNRCHPPCRIC